MWDPESTVAERDLMRVISALFQKTWVNNFVTYSSNTKDLLSIAQIQVRSGTSSFALRLTVPVEWT